MIRVALIACGASKGPARTKASELYTGELVRSSLRWARENCDRAFIVSALHGLVSLDAEISPYDFSMSDLDSKERESWGEQVIDRLASLTREGGAIAPVLLAGEAYAGPLRFPLERRTAEWRALMGKETLDPWGAVEEPLRGLQIGQRLSWLKTKKASPNYFHDAERNAADMGTPSDGLVAITVPASRIFVIPGFNSRKDFAPKPGGDVLSDPELAADIAKRGLDSPVRVEPIKAQTIVSTVKGTPDLVIPHDSYALIFGERRLRACRSIDPEYPVTATLQPESQRSPLGRRLANLHENLNRKGLTLWELGEAVANLAEEHKLTKEQIAEQLGYTVKHVGNMIRLRSKLDPEIWEHVRKVGASMDRAVLFSICMLPKEEQMKAYKAALEKRKTRGAAAKERKEKKAAAGKKRKGSAGEGDGGDAAEATGEELSRARAGLASLDENPPGSKAFEKGARAALRFILGETESIE